MELFASLLTHAWRRNLKLAVPCPLLAFNRVLLCATAPCCRRGMPACLSSHTSHIARCVRGIGGSTIFPSFWEYSTDGFAADALALLEHLGWERTHLIGMSLGGELAAVLGMPCNVCVRCGAV